MPSTIRSDRSAQVFWLGRPRPLHCWQFSLRGGHVDRTGHGRLAGRHAKASSGISLATRIELASLSLRPLAQISERWSGACNSVLRLGSAHFHTGHFAPYLSPAGEPPPGGIALHFAVSTGDGGHPRASPCAARWRGSTGWPQDRSHRLVCSRAGVDVEPRITRHQRLPGCRLRSCHGPRTGHPHHWRCATRGLPQQHDRRWRMPRRRTIPGSVGAPSPSAQALLGQPARGCRSTAKPLYWRRLASGRRTGTRGACRQLRRKLPYTERDSGISRATRSDWRQRQIQPPL